MSDARRVGLLSSRDHPLLPYLLRRLRTAGDVEPVLILDARTFSEKDFRIFRERTGARLPRLDPAPFLRRHHWVTVSDHNARETEALVRAEGLSLLVNAGTPRLIGPALLDAAARGVLNVHPGILPRYRGANCCEWAIYNDDPVGVTAHFMDQRLDAGPIIFTRELPVRRGQVYEEVRVALYELAHVVVVEAIRAIFDENLTPASLPAQPEGSVFKPMPSELLEIVKTRLADGEYAHAR